MRNGLEVEDGGEQTPIAVAMARNDYRLRVGNMYHSLL